MSTDKQKPADVIEEEFINSSDAISTDNSAAGNTEKSTDTSVNLESIRTAGL